MASEGEPTTTVEQPKVETEIKTDDTANAVDPKALMAELAKLKATNERLLQESKENKTKYATLKSNVDKETKDKLEKDQDWKSLLDQEKATNQTMQDNLLKLKKQTIRKALDFEVARHAKDAYEVEDIINSLDKEAITIDEETLSVNGVEEAVNALRSKKSYLFNSNKKPSMVDDRPGFVKPEKKKIEQMNINESMATLKDLMLESVR